MGLYLQKLKASTHLSLFYPCFQYLSPMIELNQFTRTRFQRLSEAAQQHRKVWKQKTKNVCALMNILSYYWHRDWYIAKWALHFLFFRFFKNPLTTISSLKIRFFWDIIWHMVKLPLFSLYFHEFGKLLLRTRKWHNRNNLWIEEKAIVL